jgi:hypothetical protein
MPAGIWYDIVHEIEQFGDKINCGHVVLLSVVSQQPNQAGS